MTSKEDDDEEKAKSEQQQQQEQQSHEDLPLDWTQASSAACPVMQVRYPTDVADIDPNDDEVMIVGTAGQKITRIGKDFHRFVNPALKKLILRSHLIKVMEGIQNFRQLKLLELYDNQVEELACLGRNRGSGRGGGGGDSSNNDNDDNDNDNNDDDDDDGPGVTLDVLDMSYNSIRDMSPVAMCPNLQELYLANNKLRTMAGLRGLTKLRKIDLGANRIRVMDAAELSGLTNLEELWLGKNKIEMIQGLESLTKLRRLDVQSNRLTTVENLTGQLPNTLEELYLAHNGITNDGAFTETGLRQNFTQLSVLDLSRNRLTEATPFAHLTKLDELWLSGNNIATFTAVQALSALGQSLETLYLEYNPIQQDPLYRKKLKEVIPSLTQIDATMVTSLAAQGMAPPSSSSAGLRAETEEEHLRRLQDMVVQRAKAESAQHKQQQLQEQTK